MDAPDFWLMPHEIVLRDKRTVILRPEEDKDLEPTWEMMSTLSRESLQYLPIPFTRERVEGWFKKIDYNVALPILGIVKETNKERIIASATLAFSNRDYDKHKASFGISVHDDYQNAGLGSYLTGYMIRIGRAKGLKKIVLEVVSHNERAIKVYEKNGFRIEGKLVNDHWNYILNKYSDILVMGIQL